MRMSNNREETDDDMHKAGDTRSNENKKPGEEENNDVSTCSSESSVVCLNDEPEHNTGRNSGANNLPTEAVANSSTKVAPNSPFKGTPESPTKGGGSSPNRSGRGRGLKEDEAGGSKKRVLSSRVALAGKGRPTRSDKRKGLNEEPRLLRKPVVKRESEGKIKKVPRSRVSLARKGRSAVKQAIAVGSGVNKKVFKRPSRNKGQVKDGNSCVTPSGKALLSDDKLPVGWRRELVRRQKGSSAGRIDVYIYGPGKLKFRSRNEIKNYIMCHKLNLNPNHFDFSVR